MTLRALIEAVERGELDVAAIEDALSSFEQYDACISAFHCSLDAAFALHEALLPGWVYGLNTGFQRKAHAVVGQPGVSFFAGNNDTGNPARAWLLAILRAVEAESRK